MSDFEENNFALLFDVQSSSVHDGPGQRTTLFFSGCPLHCPWCSNPEGQKKSKRLFYSEIKCKLCLKCVKNCSHQAMSFNQHLSFDRNLCDNVCDDFSCMKECYSQAISRSGIHFTIDDFKKLVRRERSFWGQEGGVTFSGGEPLLWHSFLQQLLDYSQKHYIHTAIETTGYASWDVFSSIIEQIDFVFIDLKQINNEKHQQVVGVSNGPILSNLSRFIREKKDFPGRIIIRVPLIPSFNDDKKSLSDLLQWMKIHHLKELNFLPLHHYAMTKYGQLGLKYNATDYKPTVDSLDRNQIEKIVRDENIQFYFGSDTPF